MKGYKNSTKTVYETEASANYAKGGKAMAKVGKVMGEFKAGALHSGSKKGPAVTNRKQAIAIGLSEARKAGADVPMLKAKGGVVEKGSGEVYKSKATMKRHEAAESPAKERSEHKQIGGLLAEREMAARGMVGKAKGGYAKGHKFGSKANLKVLTPGHKFKNGGKVGC